MFRLVPLVACAPLVAMVAAVSPGRAQDSTPESMPNGAPGLVDAYVAALNAHDPARVAALYAEDATVEQMVQDGSHLRGRAAIQDWVASNLQGVPDLTVTTESVIAQGKQIGWAWAYRGAYTGQYPGLPAGQGQPIDLHGWVPHRAAGPDRAGGPLLRQCRVPDSGRSRGHADLGRRLRDGASVHLPCRRGGRRSARRLHAI